MLRKQDVPLAAGRYSRSIKLHFWLNFHSHELNRDPGSLFSLQCLVTTHQRFLVVERFNNDTDEKLDEEHANDDNKNHSVNDHENVVILLRHLIGAYSVD